MKKNSIPKLELVFLLLLTGMCPQAHATDDGRNASPQKTYAVDLTLGSATVLTFTEAVTSQTGVLFSYESALSQMPLGDVSVHETAAPLEHILEKVFKGRGFRYKVVDRIVVLTYDTDSARSQLVLVTGRVKDGSGMPLVGASVVVKDTMRGVSAGAEGNYRIFADPDATLVFSYIGYADREERIGTRSAIDVVLEEYEAVLEDVVVVGYGTQSRRTVTAAISKFDGHLLEGIPVNSVGDALKGRIPGVRVATTDATPGADPKFLIRGGSSINQSNDPIVLVDGVVREMAGLNPNDIESVSFLKDAAAAGIYGSRASNGVILITTKKGSKHLGPRIVFEGQWAWASPATKFDLMNARDYILTVRPALMEGYCGGMDPASVLGGEQSAGTGNTAKSLWTTRYLRPDEQVPAGYQWVEDPVNPGRIIVFEDNDQQSQWFGDACWQNYYVGIDGGGDNIQYAASAGYTDDSGIGITTGYSRFTFHGNTTFQVTRRLRASTTFDYSQIEQQTFESAPLSLRNSVIRGLSVPNTHRDWYGEEAGEELAGTPALGTNNTTIPAAYYAYYYHNAGSTIKRSTATINLDWEVFDGLRLVGQFTNYNRHTRSYFYVEDNPTTGSNIRPMKEGFSETNRMDFQAYADYKGTFGNGHRLGAVAGYEYMLDKLNSFDVRVQGAVSDKLPVLDAGTSNIANYPKSTRTRECLISYFGRVNYDYGGRYLLAATMRIDGSSKFAAGHRWGYFPAASAGWVVSKEGFWPQNSAVSMLKARVSYGLTGNNGIGLYDTYGSYNSLYTYNGNATTTTNTMPNNGLIWEKTLQFNAGIDLGLLDNRITLALDYYNKETRDLLFDVSLPNTTGYNSVSTNLGRVRFYGTELSLSSVNIDRKGFSWRTDFTYSYNMNRVLELPDNGNPRNRINGISVGDGSQFGGIAEGERMGRIFGYVAERIIETQEEADAARYDTQSRGYRRSDRRQIAGRKDIGDYEWKDRPGSTRMDGRQIINAEDQFLLGYALPHSTGGIGNTFRYRNWTLNVYMDYALGHSVRNDMQMRYFQSTMGNCNYNLVNEVKKCWSQPGDDTRYARFTANDTDWGNRNYGRTSDIFVEKADYLCLRDVSLSWSLPKAWLRKLHISDVTLTVSGNTLRARGDGTLNLQINPRSNVFEMYGDYTITEGSFLFSLQNIINKRFVIENGSTIQWTGSPMDAMLNINAIYKLKASLQPLLQGTSDNLTADRSVPVECVIHLGERLSNPAVTFDVHVPGTDPETQTVIANALTTPETVDTQFAYLLLFNSFMGENSSSSSNIGTSVSAATGLEFVSNMVSNLLSNDDYNIVIRYRPKSELTSDEVDFGLSKSLINNRLFVEVEGNYLIDNKQAVNSSMSNFMGEAYITYLIDRAGTLKAKAFTQTIDRFDENQGLQETGIGIYFKEDFNNFRDLRRRIRERFTNKKRKARREARRQAAREEKERLRQPADTLSALRPVMDKKDENN